MSPSPAGKTDRVKVGEIPFASSTLEEATQEVLGLAKRRQAVSVRLANAYCVALASKDEAYGRLLNRDGVNYPDGLPVVWCMRGLLGSEQAGRVRGPSLFLQVLDKGRAQNVRHFFLGSTESTLKLLTANIEERFEGLDIAGSYAPPFGPVDSEFLADACARVLLTDADIVWVALGTPKQDFAASALAAALGRPCVAVGAAFDFAAGTVNEAPKWMRDSGFEWLYRFGSEPSRLWKRYTIGNLSFLAIVGRQVAIQSLGRVRSIRRRL